jgi:hypothetical protein
MNVQHPFRVFFIYGNNVTFCAMAYDKSPVKKIEGLAKTKMGLYLPQKNKSWPAVTTVIKSIIPDRHI